jgi:hypothetical protein
MHIIISILLLLAGLISLMLIIALFMKKDLSVKCDIIINTNSKKAYDFLKLLNNQDKFNKWAKADANREWTHKGTDGTVGYVISWKGNKDAGEGEKEIINLVEGKRIVTEIRFVKPMKITSTIIMETEAISANSTKVTLINSGKMNYPMNLFIPIAENKFPKDMNESLESLTKILENE